MLPRGKKTFFQQSSESNNVVTCEAISFSTSQSYISFREHLFMLACFLKKGHGNHQTNPKWQDLLIIVRTSANSHGSVFTANSPAPNRSSFINGCPWSHISRARHTDLHPIDLGRRLEIQNQPAWIITVVGVPGLGGSDSQAMRLGSSSCSSCSSYSVHGKYAIFMILEFQ